LGALASLEEATLVGSLLDDPCFLMDDSAANVSREVQPVDKRYRP
jgi:hypothetical protein